MGIQDLVYAAMQALMMEDTVAIKGILREGSHAEYVYSSVAGDRFQISLRDLFKQVHATIPENIRGPNYFNYDDGILNVLLLKAVMISDYELIRLLVENGANATSTIRRGLTALHIACEEESFEIIKFLTQNSPAYILDICDELGRTPLDIACEHHSPDVIQFLLSQGSSVGEEESERIPLLSTIIHNQPEYVLPVAFLLIEAGANINYASEDLGTPLIAAIRKCPSQMRLAANSITSRNPYEVLCMLLIDRGCDVNAVNSEGKTALHFAVEAELENIVRKLLINGSDIDRYDNFGVTPLHIACENGNQRIVDLLIISGANLRAHDWEVIFEMWRRLRKLNERNTPLLKYVINKSEQCLSLKSLCNIAIRKNIRNVEVDATQLGLPEVLVKGLQLID